MSDVIDHAPIIGDSPDAIMQRIDAIHCLSIALADNGIVDPHPTEQHQLVDAKPILASLEDQGYTLRLTTPEERRIRNAQGMSR